MAKAKLMYCLWCNEKLPKTVLWKHNRVKHAVKLAAMRKAIEEMNAVVYRNPMKRVK
jgi:hypothetical protein